MLPMHKDKITTKLEKALQVFVSIYKANVDIAYR